MRNKADLWILAIWLVICFTAVIIIIQPEFEVSREGTGIYTMEMQLVRVHDSVPYVMWDNLNPDIGVYEYYNAEIDALVDNRKPGTARLDYCPYTTTERVAVYTEITKRKLRRKTK